jgi:guanylate kinase
MGANFGYTSVMDPAQYQPAPDVIRHLQEIDFVAVVGPTAVGKTTLIKAAVAREPRLHMLVGGTSRDPRPGEQDRVDFHFGNREDMLARIQKGAYATLAVGATDDLYTTAPEDYPAGKTALLAVLAYVITDFRKLPYKTFRTIFILPPDYRTWQQRLKRHSFDAGQLRRRLVEAERSLVFSLEDEAVQFVINDTLDIAARDLIALATGRQLDPRQQADQSRARMLAGEQLLELRRALGQT